MAGLELGTSQISKSAFGTSQYVGKKGKSEVHTCTGTEALYRPYGP
jgi:hypothetical protein